MRKFGCIVDLNLKKKRWSSDESLEKCDDGDGVIVILNDFLDYVFVKVFILMLN